MTEEYNKKYEWPDFGHCVKKVAEWRTEVRQPPRVVVICGWNENNTGSWDEGLAHLCVRLYRESDSCQVRVCLFWGIQVQAMQSANAKARKSPTFRSRYPLHAVRHWVADWDALFILPSLLEICSSQAPMHTPQALHDSSPYGVHCKVNAGDISKTAFQAFALVSEQYSTSR